MASNFPERYPTSCAITEFQILCVCSVCMCVHILVHTRGYAHSVAPECGSQRPIVGVSPQLPPCVTLGLLVLSVWFPTVCARLADSPASGIILFPTPISQECWDLYANANGSWCYLSSGSLNSGPHVLRSRALLLSHFPRFYITYGKTTGSKHIRAELDGVHL